MGLEEVDELLAAVGRNTGATERPLLSHHSIISAARKIISSEGHEALSLRRLSLDLGVTPPALYAHVESKEDLLRAVAHSEFEWLVMNSAKINSRDPVERLRSLQLLVVDYARNNCGLFRLLLLFPPEFKREDFEVTEPPTSLGGRVLRAEAEAVRDAIDQGRFVVDDPFLIGMTLYTTVHGVATLLASDPKLPAGFGRQLAEHIIDTVLRGLSKRGIGAKNGVVRTSSSQSRTD